MCNISTTIQFHHASLLNMSWRSLELSLALDQAFIALAMSYDLDQQKTTKPTCRASRKQNIRNEKIVAINEPKLVTLAQMLRDTTGVHRMRGDKINKISNI